MDTLGNAILGTAFLLFSASLTFLMYYLWGFPFDHKTHKSSAPKSLMRLHRLLGYGYTAIYIYFMAQMVPRMWTYQIELPARTVAHMMIGLGLGAILIIKIIIVRYYKHMETTLVPFLGTLLFIGTILLMGLALPSAFREVALRNSALSGTAYTEERRTHLESQLRLAGLEDDQKITKLTTPRELQAGRTTLISKCVQCHDLRTVLARPRTPDAWRQTVTRMASRSTVLEPITEEEQWLVTSYLIAISPTLQQTAKLKRNQDKQQVQSHHLFQGMEAAAGIEGTVSEQERTANEERFRALCSQCHGIEQIQNAPPQSQQEVIDLVQRMVRNGLRASEEELQQIMHYLHETYVTEPSATPVKDSTNVFVIRPLGNEMRFDVTEIRVSAGSQVKVIMENTASITSMPHNVTFVKDAEALDDIIEAALTAPAFIPEHEAIFATTGNTPPEASTEVVFTAPDPGTYTYLCTVPGHAFSMRGTLIVE